jgi:hypothetical protein
LRDLGDFSSAPPAVTVDQLRADAFDEAAKSVAAYYRQAS